MNYKKDKDLGLKVGMHLKNLGIETPISEFEICSNEQKVEIEILFSDIMKVMKLNQKDDSLKDTPSRVAKMFVDEIFYGLDYANFPKCTTVENKAKYDSMVIEKDINVSSNCEHHFVPIDGFAHIAYIPKNKVLGLSKLNRVTDFFSRRPQIQERLTQQICNALQYILETDNVAVVINANHFCVKSRGIRDVHSSTTTSCLSGVFKDDQSCRSEFMALIG